MYEKEILMKIFNSMYRPEKKFTLFGRKSSNKVTLFFKSCKMFTFVAEMKQKRALLGATRQG